MKKKLLKNKVRERNGKQSLLTYFRQDIFSYHFSCLGYSYKYNNKKEEEVLLFYVWAKLVYE